MKPTLTHPTWDQIHIGTMTLAVSIKRDIMDTSRDGYKPDYIIGLTRGGLVPAVILSQTLDIPMISVSYSAYGGNGDNKNHANILPTIYTLGDIQSGTGKLPPVPKLLIVDDICDSGKTLQEVTEHYKRQGHPVKTASLYYKDRGSKQVITPNYYWQMIEEGSPWIKFPWELSTFYF